MASAAWLRGRCAYPSGDPRSVKNISATLATVWRIAGPYFRSEDKWAGRGLLGVVVVMELALVAINVLLNQWQNRFYSALQAYDLNEFVMQVWIFLGLAFAYVGVGRLQALPEPVAADPLAAMDDATLSRRMAPRRHALPHAAEGRRRR